MLGFAHAHACQVEQVSSHPELAPVFERAPVRLSRLRCMFDDSSQLYRGVNFRTLGRGVGKEDAPDSCTSLG